MVSWETVFVALIVSVIGPVILALVVGWVHHLDKRDANSREDELRQQAIEDRAADEQRADRVEEAAEATRKQAEHAAELLVANNELVQATAADAAIQLNEVKQIGLVTHGLVNSDKTATMRATVASMRKTLILTRELADLKAKMTGEPISAEMAQAMASDQIEIDAQEKAIQERLDAQALAEQQAGLPTT